MDLTKCHGRKFSAEIKGTQCKGTISVEKNNVYLCQDEVQGLACNNTFNYKYSWLILENGRGIDVNFLKNFKLLCRTIEDVEVGDLINDGDYTYKVLVKSNDCVLLSDGDNYHIADAWYTIEELKDGNCFLQEQSTPLIRKITHAEIAEKFGVEVGGFEAVE